jgi:hypothetical protein
MEKPDSPFQMRRSPDFIERYGNACSMYQTVSDIRLIFSLLGEAPPSSSDDRPCIVQHTAIILSPQQAKMVHTMLGQNIEHYERQFGEIRTQPGAPGLVVPASGLPKGKM